MELTKIVEQVKPIFDSVAEKIGQGAEFGWEVVVKQQYIEGGIGLFFSVIGLVALVLSYKVTKSASKEGNSDNFVGGVIIAMCGLTAFLVGGFYAVTRLINPEFYAIEFLINLIP